MRKPTAYAVTASLLTLTAACTSVSAGQPVPAETQPVPQVTSTAADSTIAPPVTQPPLSFGRFASQPCQTLSRDQLASLGTTKDPGHETKAPVGPECAWQSDAASSGFHIGVTLMINTLGLDALYSTRYSGQGYFAPTEVGGYPAVNADHRKPIGRTTPEGDCFTAVGIAKGVAFRVSYAAYGSHPDRNEPCKASERIAAMVLDNLKAG